MIHHSKINIIDYTSTVKAAVNKLLSSRSIIHCSIEKEDLYQIAWIAVIHCAKTYDTNRGATFATYATRAIINAVNAELKKLLKKKFFTLTTDSSANIMCNTADDILNHVIELVERSGKFSRIERKVFWLKFTDNLCFTKIGKQMGVSRETVRKMYQQSIDKLKELMNDEF